MSCHPESLKNVPLFALLDDDEAAILASQVELKKFAPRERIYKIGDTDGHAYVMVAGRVRVTTVDEDHQEVVVDEPSHGEFFGFASMLEQTPHQTNAIAIEETNAWKSIATTSSSSCKKNLTPVWTCSPSSAGSFIPRNSSSEFAPAAILMK